MTRKFFVVVYWWHGERYVAGTRYKTKREAVSAAMLVVAAGFPAQVERRFASR